jgi:protein SCO1/2
VRSTLVLIMAALLAGCSSPSSDGAGSPPLQGARIGGPFALVDQNGKNVKDTDFAGQYRLIYFGYTYCPDICPIDAQKLMRGLAQFEKADPVRGAKVQPLFITVDPERDNPETLKAFVERYHPRLIGLTGTPEQVAEVTKSFAVVHNKQAGSAPDRYLVAHSQLAFLMDPEGKPLALMPLDDAMTDADEGKPELVAAELEKWVK